TRIVIDRPVEVRVELVGEQGAKANRSGRSSLLPRERCDDGRPYDAELDAESAQHLSRHAFALTDETQQEMPGADVLVAELTGFEERELEDLLRARRERDVSGRWGPSASDDLLDLHPDRSQRDLESFERPSADAFALGDHPEQEVLGPDVVVVQESCLPLGEHDHAARTLREPFEHAASVLPLVAR